MLEIRSLGFGFESVRCIFFSVLFEQGLQMPAEPKNEWFLPRLEFLGPVLFG